MRLSSLLLLVSLARSVHSFTIPNQIQHRRTRLAATLDDPQTSSWSKSGSSSSSSSRFGLRRRVKAVLQKAKDRTGLDNANTSDRPTSAVVAEAASIGGLDRDTDLVYRPVNGTDSDFSIAELAIKVDASGVDALLQGQVPLEPLPFTLPTLTAEQRRLLEAGERVQEQSKMGREGSGFVVLDVQAPPYIVWECLLDFEAYPDNIGTVRSMRMFTNSHLKSSYIAEKPVLPGTGKETRHYGTASITRASFVLSKFRLNIAAVHRYQPHPDGHYMEFTLDKACRNVVLQDAKGIWYTEAEPNGRPGVTRVWLMCELKVSSMLPTFIVDYAARRAMPRATTWLQPTVERAKQKLLGPANGART